MALTDYIEDLLPGWMARGDTSHWLKLGVTVAAMVDAMVDAVYEGRYAAFPGQNDNKPNLFTSIDALPLVGRDRRILRGPRETHGMYAHRLRMWRRTHAEAGTAFGCLNHFAGMFAPGPPRMRLYNDNGTCYTRESDGTLYMHTTSGAGLKISRTTGVTLETGASHPWDWDSLNLDIVDRHGTNAGRIRSWLIIYATGPDPLTMTEGTWGDGTSSWGDPDGTIGTSATPELVSAVLGTVREWSATGVFIPWVIVAFDDASFDPLTPGPYPAAGMPDGQWGHAWKNDGGTYVESRLNTARYWRCEQWQS